MRFLSTVSLLLLFSTTSYSQSAFEVLFQNSQDDRVLDIVEDMPGVFYAVGYSGYNNQPASYKGLIYKLRSAADTFSMRIVFSDTVTRLFKICKLQNHQFLLFGSISYPPSYEERLLIMKIDSNINMIWKKDYKQFNYDHVYRLDFIQGHGEDIWLFGNMGMIVNGQYDFVLVKINCNGDTLKSGRYTPWNPTPRCGIFSPDSSKLWFFGASFDYNNIGQRAEFDTSFNIQRIDWISPTVHGNMNVRWFSDSSLLLIGKYYKNSTLQDDDVGISFMDTSLNSPDIHFFGATDTCDNPGAERCMDLRENNRIFYAGVHNVIFDFFPEGPSWIMTGLLNQELIPTYERYYGGDAYYVPSSILATQDNGSIIAATRYDYKTQNYEHDVIFLKLNEDGVITSNNSGFESFFSDFLVYPNPGENSLKIKTTHQHFSFSLYSFSGEHVLKKEITNEHVTFMTNNLQPGIYVYEIIDENNKIHRGKWIKKQF